MPLPRRLRQALVVRIERCARATSSALVLVSSFPSLTHLLAIYVIGCVCLHHHNIFCCLWSRFLVAPSLFFVVR
ncbi:hypothetical protein C8T65DRAFT_662302 [Cerioporus squamosus]|nr:hypothetical protein C8T65DRAFT_662302 [Cerioporus squamosus]